MALFKATKLQVATYLLGICPFSIAFLVFLNSSVSFVITDLIGRDHGQGDAVGTLGFADELLALVACPTWGLLSDRIGLRTVCTLAYFIIALALVLFVQAKNVYPQLLLGRLLFSVGGAAASTMVTAILPAVVLSKDPSVEGRNGVEDGDEATGTQTPQQAQIDRISREYSDSISSDTTITPASLQRERNASSRRSIQSADQYRNSASSSSRVAGFVGLFTGIGALISLSIFLPLPAKFQEAGSSPGQALQNSYYIVACVAIVLSIWSFIGLRDIRGEESKGLMSLFRRSSPTDPTPETSKGKASPFWKRFTRAFALGFQHPSIGLGYIGGFVARASSVGISLFIPLAINAQFRSAGLCNVSSMDSPEGLPDIKKHCPRAYTLAAEMTGVSQLIALLAAPAFGYLSSKLRRNTPLMIGALSGIAGYIAFGIQATHVRKTINGTALDFLSMALIGLSQIAAIVCSLGILSEGILQQDGPSIKHNHSSHEHVNEVAAEDTDGGDAADESTGLISSHHPEDESMQQLKGSIAGMYSLYGGAGILLLTKVGGVLFDSLSFGSPFFMMAIFNGILLVVCILTLFARTC